VSIWKLSVGDSDGVSAEVIGLQACPSCCLSGELGLESASLSALSWTKEWTSVNSENITFDLVADLGGVAASSLDSLIIDDSSTDGSSLSVLLFVSTSSSSLTVATLGLV
jgi:hypothetical protein